MNPKAETVEELQARRKNLYLGMLKLAREDLDLAVKTAIKVLLYFYCDAFMQLEVLLFFRPPSGGLPKN